MSSLGFIDYVKLAFKVIGHKYEQNKLATNINALVSTPKGSVKGLKRVSTWGDPYYSFEKIPFAKPPIGELRFRAPQPVEPWEGILDCTKAAEKPLQADIFFKKYKGSEDCLYLNVFTNDLHPQNPRPVMVWIYGGGFQAGDATRDLYSPDFFMSKDVVLVTIAYRLGPLGFLYFEDSDLNVPGNAGIKDQIMSLRWVQENIASFGGDPNNVTLFGESAGGTSTHICMISEQSKGLIHKGIVMSGSALCPWAILPKKSWAYRFAQQLGYKGEEKDKAVYEFLRNVSGPDMVKASSKVLTKDEKHHRMLFAFTPIVEPYVTDQCILSIQPHELLKTTWSNQIPLMIGGTSFEGLFLYSDVTSDPSILRTDPNCKNLLPIDLDISRDSSEAEQFGLALKKAYFGEQECGVATKMQFLELESYREFWHPIFRTVLARLQHATAPTYIYRFDFDSKDGNGFRNLLCGPGVTGVCHGDDVCYLFHSIISYRAPRDSPEHRVARQMIDIFTSFAAKSDPNCEMLQDVIFEPLKKDDDIKCLNVSDKVEFIPLPEMEKLKVWNSFYASGKL